MGSGPNSPDTSSQFFAFYDAGYNTFQGSITRNGAAAVAFNASSDRRIKENIATTTLGLADLMRLNVRDFDFIKDPAHATTTGYIAQELNQVFHDAVTTNGDNGEVPLGASSTPWQVDYGRITPLIVKAVQDIANLADVFKSKLIAWFADAQNGVGDFFAATLHSHKEITDQLCIGSTCVTEDQLKVMLAASAAGTPVGTGAPADRPASAGADDLGATLTLNGNNPVDWQEGTPWQDNLGALFTHAGQSETIYSTTTVDTTISGTTTLDYWAVVPTSGAILHTTRNVVIPAPANDNAPIVATSSPPTTANDNQATTTNATTSAQ
jgi:endosialidase-like protein